MGSLRRKSLSHKTYRPIDFATKKQIRKMRIRDGGSPPTAPKYWFEKNGKICDPPKL